MHAAALLHACVLAHAQVGGTAGGRGRCLCAGGRGGMVRAQVGARRCRRWCAGGGMCICAGGGAARRRWWLAGSSGLSSVPRAAALLNMTLATAGDVGRGSHGYKRPRSQHQDPAARLCCVARTAARPSLCPNSVRGCKLCRRAERSSSVRANNVAREAQGSGRAGVGSSAGSNRARPPQCLGPARCCAAAL